MSIDRPATKQRAKEIIRTSQPNMVLAGMIVVLLGALIGYLSLRLTGIDSKSIMKALEAANAGRTEQALAVLSKSSPGAGESLLDVLLRFAMSIVGIGFSFFVMNSVRKTGAVLANLLDGFAFMPRALLLLILEYIFIVLWSMLFLIPGIIAAYRYSFAVYLMIDHPEYSAMDCIRESKRMTNGYKGQLFILDLSFILWQLLSALPIVGYAAQMVLMPYRETSKFLYYEQIRDLIYA